MAARLPGRHPRTHDSAQLQADLTRAERDQLAVVRADEQVAARVDSLGDPRALALGGASLPADPPAAEGVAALVLSADLVGRGLDPAAERPRIAPREAREGERLTKGAPEIAEEER